MRDSDIRLALYAKLSEEYGNDPTTFVRPEVGLCAGKRRIDVMVVNGELTGYEIKSDEDTLARLVGQAEAYGLVLDRAVLVTTNRYLEDALAVLPNWWGVTVARAEDNVVHLECVRSPALNCEHDAFALAQFLWRGSIRRTAPTQRQSRSFQEGQILCMEHSR